MPVPREATALDLTSTSIIATNVWHLRSGIAPCHSSRPVTLTANPTTCPRVSSFRFGCGHNSNPSRPFGFGVPLGQSKPRKKRRLRDPLGDTSCRTRMRRDAGRVATRAGAHPAGHCALAIGIGVPGSAWAGARAHHFPAAGIPHRSRPRSFW